VESMSGGVALIDYDRDGWPDIYFTNAQSVEMALHGQKAHSALFHNNRDGTFTDVSRKSGVANEEHRYGLTSIWSDFDNDGKLDLFVTNDGQPNYLYQGNGRGVFEEVGFSSGVALSESGSRQANMGVALGDYMHTGRMSLLISHFDNEYAAFYRNDGGMSFTDVSVPSGIAKATRGYVGWGDAFVDFANSGWQDIFVVNGHVYPQVDQSPSGLRYLEPKILLMNQRNGTFKDISDRAGAAIQIPQVSRGMAIGDLFNDGKLEAVVENLKGQPMILRPEGGAQNHWVSFQLEGVKSDRLALNARVRATAGDLVQLGEVVSGGSYLSQNDLRIHFGLGEHPRVDKAEVL